MVACRVLLLTGAPGIGKTTVIRRVAERLRGRKLGGFYTDEIRVGRERRDFARGGLDATERIIAHMDIPKIQQVGKYGVDVAAIDEAAARLVPDPAIEVYLVDEIGRMECLSERFITQMRALLSGPRPVVATIALRGSGFIEEVRRAEDAVIWDVTHANRDEVPSRILGWLSTQFDPNLPVEAS